MAAPRKYPDELRERATRMSVELRQDLRPRWARSRVWPSSSASIARPRGTGLVRQAEIDGGVRAGTTTTEAERIAQLEQENRELRRANHILQTDSAFFAAELDCPTSR